MRKCAIKFLSACYYNNAAGFEISTQWSLIYITLSEVGLILHLQWSLIISWGTDQYTIYNHNKWGVQLRRTSCKFIHEHMWLKFICVKFGITINQMYFDFLRSEAKFIRFLLENDKINRCHFFLNFRAQLMSKEKLFQGTNSELPILPRRSCMTYKERFPNPHLLCSQSQL